MNDALTRTRSISLAARASQLVKTFFLTAVGLITISAASSAHAQVSPVGSWDFTISGNSRGASVIIFEEDGNLFGSRVTIPPAAKDSSGSSDPRGGTSPGVDPRTSSSNTATNSGSTTNSYGGATISGNWFFGPKNTIIGFYAELYEKVNPNGTNTMHTNGVSFTATVKPTKMTLRAYSVLGKNLLTGVPTGAAPDLTGGFFVEGRKKSAGFNEFILLQPLGQFDNVYRITGFGPNYDIVGGRAILTANGNFVLQPIRSNGDFLTVSGKYNLRKNTAALKGFANDGSAVRYGVIQQP